VRRVSKETGGYLIFIVKRSFMVTSDVTGRLRAQYIKESVF
jgi:hypothetical protein